MSRFHQFFGPPGSAKRLAWIVAVPAATLLLSWVLSSWFPLLIFGIFIPVSDVRGFFRRGERPETPEEHQGDGARPGTEN